MCATEHIQTVLADMHYETNDEDNDDVQSNDGDSPSGAHQPLLACPQTVKSLPKMNSAWYTTQPEFCTTGALNMQMASRRWKCLMCPPYH